MEPRRGCGNGCQPPPATASEPKLLGAVLDPLGPAGQRGLVALVRVGVVHLSLVVEPLAVALGRLVQCGLETDLERVGGALLLGARVGRDVRDERGGVAGIPRVTLE